MFQKRSKDNPDGWGVAYYPNKAAQVIKEAIPAGKSTLYPLIAKPESLRTKILVAHVRHASVSTITHENTHPFHRELHGKEYVFAHNGTLINYREFETGRFTPIGETDSEYAFCSLMHFLESNKYDSFNENYFSSIQEYLHRLNEHGRLNCIFSEGTYLFCYHDKNGYVGLHYAYRRAPFHPIHLIDEDLEINLAEAKLPSQKGFIIASQPMTNEHWSAFNPGTLKVLKDGELIFPNQ